MDKNTKLALMAASAIHAALKKHSLTATRRTLGKISTAKDHCDALVALERKLQLAEARNWDAAYKRMISRVQIQITHLQTTADELKYNLQHCASPLPDIKTIFQDLRQLEQEFDTFTFNRSTVSVTTEPIELRDVYLGPFKIIIDIDSLSHADILNTLVIEAVEPNFSSGEGDRGYTHPHIQDTTLCTGEATDALIKAAREGRIADFVMIVDSVLKTYNPGSAYFSLDDWGGESCWGCESIESPEDLYTCEHCDHRFCRACVMFCTVCDEPVCNTCKESCPVCNDDVCPGCISTCSECCTRQCENCRSNCTVAC